MFGIAHASASARVTRGIMKPFKTHPSELHFPLREPDRWVVSTIRVATLRRSSPDLPFTRIDVSRAVCSLTGFSLKKDLLFQQLQCIVVLLWRPGLANTHQPVNIEVVHRHRVGVTQVDLSDPPIRLEDREILIQIKWEPLFGH